MYKQILPFFISNTISHKQVLITESGRNITAVDYHLLN